MTEWTFFHFRSVCLPIHKRLLNTLCFQRFKILPDLNICFRKYCKTCNLLDTHEKGHRWHPVKHVVIKLKLNLPCNWGELVILLLGTIAIESFMWVKPEKNNAMHIQEIVTSKLFSRWDELGGKRLDRNDCPNTQSDGSLRCDRKLYYLYLRFVGPCDDQAPVARSAFWLPDGHEVELRSVYVGASGREKWRIRRY